MPEDSIPDKTKHEISRYLSYILRHRPDTAAVSLDDAGWAAVVDVLDACRRRGWDVAEGDLTEVVATNDKQRFALSPDGRLIRANQGHSVGVELGLVPLAPPVQLYHGTSLGGLELIEVEGLRKMSRDLVHLSADPQTAREVGRRHGQPIVLTVAADRMHGDRHVFYRSDNGVWLTDRVPPEYLEIP